MAYVRSINRVEALGQATRFRDLQRNGETIGVTFSIAAQRQINDKNPNKEVKQATDYIPCNAWGNIAKYIQKNVKDGDMVLVIGSWVSGSYKTGGGNTVYTNNCTVSSVYNLSLGNNISGADVNGPQKIADKVFDEEFERYKRSDEALNPDDLPF